MSYRYFCHMSFVSTCWRNKFTKLIRVQPHRLLKRIFSRLPCKKQRNDRVYPFITTKESVKRVKLDRYTITVDSTGSVQWSVRVWYNERMSEERWNEAQGCGGKHHGRDNRRCCAGVVERDDTAAHARTCVTCRVTVKVMTCAKVILALVNLHIHLWPFKFKLTNTRTQSTQSER